MGSWCAEDRHMRYEQERLDADQARAAQRLEFPTGYHSCCGMSRARGHADLCPKNLMPEEGEQK
jgi:hypothetical protein